ncbi:zinc finger protein 771-like [Micropterus salmoides]|uniref:zinc finger protein 771-like n=1 Tax=Micropterus salmoides TaxID=27706 RepID=UPI0018EA78B0|nr:zinc finger protein 771-like [Micropterus salmoides]XP_038578996.1 zinc finger protein 771-like [Micropterus salmoides]
MSKVQTLRAFVQQRLSAAAEEIFELFERTIAEYEEELCGQRKLLDAVFKPEAGVQLLLVSEDVVPPEQQDSSPSLDQEDPPEPPHIKEEQEELFTTQEGEQLRGLENADITKFTFTPVKSEEDDEEKPQSSQLHQRLTEQMETEANGEDCGGPEPARNSDPDRPSHSAADDKMLPSSEPRTSWEGEPLRGLEEADIIKFPFSPVSVKSEEDEEEKPQSSQLHQRLTEQMETEADGEDCGGPEPARNSDLDRHLQPAAGDKTSDSSEPETGVSYDREETREPQSGLNPLQNKEVPGSDVEYNNGKTSSCSSEYAASFGHKGLQTGEKQFRCPVCDKRYFCKESLMSHMRLHSEGKPYSCSDCKKTFNHRLDLVKHMRTHTGEKPFSCSVCGRGFAQSSGLTTHFRVHTGEKPFTCSVCKGSFRSRGNLTEHMRVHTGEKPYICSICGKGFGHKKNLNQHLSVHTGEKPFSCSVCDNKFAWKSQLRKHMKIHTVEETVEEEVLHHCSLPLL